MLPPEDAGRRIIRNRLRARAETRANRGEGIDSFRLGRGSLCTMILLIGTLRVQQILAAGLVVGVYSMVDYWVRGGTSLNRRLPNRFG